MAMETLLITEEQAADLLSMEEVIEAVERALEGKATGDVMMPPKILIRFDQYNGDLAAMISYLGYSNMAGAKIGSVHGDNPRKFDLPVVVAAIVLVDPATGEPIAFMSGTDITSYRTGAAGGVAAKYLANEDSEVVGMVGTGEQATTQLLALSELFDGLNVKAYDLSEEQVTRFISKMDDRIDGSIEPVDSIQDAVAGSDIVVTTTPSKSPVISDEWVDDGTHINAIGADSVGKRELDPELLKRATIIVDDREQSAAVGETAFPINEGMLSPDDVHAELGDVVAGQEAGRTKSEEITVFDATGLALEDVAAAAVVYEKAKERGIGQTFSLVS